MAPKILPLASSLFSPDSASKTHRFSPSSKAVLSIGGVTLPRREAFEFGSDKFTLLTTSEILSTEELTANSPACGGEELFTSGSELSGGIDILLFLRKLTKKEKVVCFLIFSGP
jgi:hypothetical protein